MLPPGHAAALWPVAAPATGLGMAYAARELAIGWPCEALPDPGKPPLMSAALTVIAPAAEITRFLPPGGSRRPRVAPELRPVPPMAAPDGGSEM
mmetsp:Transcript_9915/g.21023  ORF Transcript_9915/g.21023 Transcript_9915/m.21023 type:complete len:94 (+) Transcript_9915:995-1276(+)